MTGEIEKKSFVGGKAKQSSNLKQMKIKFTPNDEKSKQKRELTASVSVNRTRSLSIGSSSEDEPLSKIVKLNEVKLNDLNEKTSIKYNKKSSETLEKNKLETISISDDDETSLSVLKKSINALKSSGSAVQQTTPKKELNDKHVARHSPRIVRIEHEKQKKIYEYNERKVQEEKRIMNNIKEREFKLEKELLKMKWEQMKNFSTQKKAEESKRPVMTNQNMFSKLPPIVSQSTINSASLNLTTTQKNVVIAIDMDPEKWKKLPPFEQARIIEEKRKLINKNMHQINIKTVNIAPKANVHSLLQPQKVSNSLLPTNYQLLSPSSIEAIKSPVFQPRPSISGVIIPKPDCLQKVGFQPAAHHVSLQTYNQEFSHIFAQKKDDEELSNLIALPRPKSVQMPPGFTSKNFGDIVMIVEFVNCFKKFLDVNDRPDITTAQLLLALTPGSKGSLITCQILLLFLKVVLGNEDYKIKGLKIELADLPLTEHTVSYLLAQFLKSQLEKMKKERRAKEIESENALVAEIAGFKKVATADKEDEYKDADEDENVEKDPTFVLDETDPTFILDDDEMEIFKARKKKIKKTISAFENEIAMISVELEKSEFYDLSTNSQLQILTYLLTIVLESEELSQFYEELANEKHEAFRVQDAHRKDVCRLRKEREKDTESSVGSIDKFTLKVASEDPHKISDYEDPQNSPNGSESKNDSTNPYHGKTKRQIEVLKAEAELNLQKKKDLERKQIEEREDVDKMNASIEQQNIKRVLEISHQCKKVLRLEPLGYDRFFRIYWLFTGGTPGLYVNGAELQSINGTVYGPDCWMYYDNMADVDNLISSLTIRGHRESKLKANLRYNYAKIKESVSLLENSIKRTQEHLKNVITTSKKNETYSINPPVLLTEVSSLNCNSDASSVENPDAKNNNRQVEEEQQEDNKKSEDTINNEKFVTQKSENNCSVLINGNENYKEKSNMESKVSSDLGNSLHPIQENAINELTVLKSQSSTSRNNELSDNKEEKTIEEDAHLASIKSLKEDVAEAARKIVAGNLGELDEPDVNEWIGKMAATKQLQEIKEYILKIHTTVYPRFLNHFMASNTQSNNFVDEWVKAVESALTLSKLHTLFGVFENSVNWNKSSENSRCKICNRGKGRYHKDHLIICDACSLAYHLTCIKPPIKEVPESTWKCPECISNSQTEKISNGKSRERTSKTTESESESSIEDSDHEDTCHVCETDGLVILCDTCPLSYHFDCHNPPLRHAPRGPWSCFECRKISKNSSVSKRTHSKYIDSDSEQGSGKKSQAISSKQKKRKSDTSESDLPRQQAKKKSSSSSKKIKKLKLKNRNLSNKKSNKKSADILNRKKRRVYDNEKETSENESYEINAIHNNTDCNGFNNSTKLGNRRPHYTKDENKIDMVHKTSDTDELSDFKINGNIQRSSRSRRKNSRNNPRESNYEIQACENILCELLRNKDSWPFIYPVNLNEAPDYLDIIKTPLTFSAMRKKLEGFQYEDAHQFLNDAKLIFENSKTYNHDTSEVGSAGIRLMSVFNTLVKRYLPELQVS
ncbi:tyrosine-protein kinase BAZ1B isoform X2 [Hydra vulgaris]|uniref:Tyrosine-protein kinase BAZ1B isoform X2 n=1 Tax=Hydra vulgaris TaxID=6087 RepID=A0ABM4BXZ1_HYDVU